MNHYIYHKNRNTCATFHNYSLCLFLPVNNFQTLDCRILRGAVELNEMSNEDSDMEFDKSLSGSEGLA